MSLLTEFIQLAKTFPFLFYRHMSVETNDPNYKKYFKHAASVDSIPPSTHYLSEFSLSNHYAIACLLTSFIPSNISLSHPFLLLQLLLRCWLSSSSVTSSSFIASNISSLYAYIPPISHLSPLLLLLPCPSFHDYLCWTSFYFLRCESFSNWEEL